MCIKCVHVRGNIFCVYESVEFQDDLVISHHLSIFSSEVLQNLYIHTRFGVDGVDSLTLALAGV